jgi:hypothetical protein
MSVSLELDELRAGYSKGDEDWEPVEWDGMIVNKLSNKVTFLFSDEKRNFTVDIDDPNLTMEIS